MTKPERVKMTSEMGFEFERNVYSALDVAKWILHEAERRKTPITHMRLQKYLFYVQAYGAQYMHGYCEAIPMFREAIIAEGYGPVVREVFEEYRKYGADPIVGAETEEAPEEELKHVQWPFECRGHLSDAELRDTVKSEDLWIGREHDKPIDVGILSQCANELYEDDDPYMMPMTEEEYYNTYCI